MRLARQLTLIENASTAGEHRPFAVANRASARLACSSSTT